jgi:hypothetical protein
MCDGVHGKMSAQCEDAVDAVVVLSSGCMRWLSLNRAQFSGLAEATERALAPEPTEKEREFKVLGEIALMLMICGRLEPRSNSLEYNSVLSAFCTAVERIRLGPEHAFSNLRLLMNVTLAFEANGRDSSKFRECIAYLMRQNLLHVRDQTPWGILGLTYFLDKCELPHNLQKNDDLLNWSILRSRPPLHSLSIHDKYALSHLFLFFGDFGLRRNFFTVLPDYESISLYLDEVVASCLLDADWDLVGEFLIAYECIGVRGSGMRNYAWEQYARHQMPGGEIEAPRWVQQKYSSSERDPRKHFQLHYHQTLVGIIASTLYLQRNE